MKHPHSSVNNLLQHLQNIYTIKADDSPAKQKRAHSQNPIQHNQKQTQGGISDLHEKQLKEKMSKIYRHPWRANGMVHNNDLHVKRLPTSDLDNWEIYRINLAERSYQNPKNYKGMKIPSVGREFIKYDCKDKEGHIPYLYESDLEKINRIRTKIYSKTFKRTNTVKHQLFGFPARPPLNRRPISQITLPSASSNSKLKST